VIQGRTAYLSGRATTKPIALLGIVLTVLGIVALAYQGITYKAPASVTNSVA
jgi:hypothetical protein